MTDQLLALIAAHLACADIAENRKMAWHETYVCSAVYDEIKLEFVPDIDHVTYRSLSPADKFAVSRQGVEAFQEWQAKNPNLVTLLEEVAKGNAKLGVLL